MRLARASPAPDLARARLGLAIIAVFGFASLFDYGYGDKEARRAG
jgi:hypothetical protein